MTTAEMVIWLWETGEPVAAAITLEFAAATQPARSPPFHQIL